MATWDAVRVSDIVQDIHDGHVVLPVIQRRLVWNEPKMELLFDSLLRGNSFGGIMVLQESQVNEPLFAVVNPVMYHTADLPEEMTFFSVDKPNALISTIKKCEDDDSIIIRVFDTLGEDSEIRITSFTEFESAVPTNIIEEETGQSKKINGKEFDLNLGHHAIETFKLK